MDLWESKNFTPMLLSEIDKPFDSSQFIYEVKFDGIRAIIYVSPDKFEIRNRHNVSMTHLYPELKSIQKIVKNPVILDGEIVSMEKGYPSFSKLQKRSHLKDKNKIKSASINDPVVFVAFDILYDNVSLIDLPLTKRKKYLDKIQDSDELIKSRFIENNGIKLFKTIQKLNLEGIVAKEKNSKYEINKRVKTWIKIKNFKREVFIIGGYIKKKGDRVSLLLGEFRDNKLYYVGNASIMTKSKLYESIIKSQVRKTSPFIDYKTNNITYITPNIKCSVTYMERTPNNHLRQPIIK